MDLTSLQPTQESLWAAATQAMASLTAEQLRNSWSGAFEKAKPIHKLTLVYFANEVCQRSKRTHAEFLSERCFGGLLPNAFGELVHQKPEYADKLHRVLQVWEERDVFDLKIIRALKSAMARSDHPSKRPRMSPPIAGSPDHGSSPQPSPRSDHAEALLSFDPLAASLARGNSSATLEAYDGRESTSPNLPYTLDIIRLAKTLEVPQQFEELFTRLGQAESDNVRFELAQETVDRLALKVYKIAKSKADADELRPVLEELSELEFARKLDSEEARVLEDLNANKDLYEAVETMEHVVVDAKQGLESIRSRESELKMQIERDQTNVIGLSELLQSESFISGSLDPARKLGISEQTAKGELEMLNDQIVQFEGLVESVKAALDERQRAQEIEERATAYWNQDRQSEAPPQQPTRPRKQRWGDPTPPSAIPGSAPQAPWNAVQEPSALWTGAPAYPPPPNTSNPPTWPLGGQSTLQSYPPPPGGYYSQPPWAYPGPPPIPDSHQQFSDTHSQRHQQHHSSPNQYGGHHRQ